MKKNFLIIATALTTLLFSCKKSDTSPNPTGGVATDSKIKTWTGGSYTTTYSYDASGRSTGHINSDGSKVENEYLSGIVKSKLYTTGGVYIYTETHELGADGIATKITRSNAPSFSELRTYNSDKQIVKILTNINGTVQNIDFFYSNGNYDSSRFSNNGNWSLTIKRTYYTDKLNSFSTDATGESFYGKESKNLLKTEQYTYPDGSKGNMTTYTYEFDAKGRATKETSTQGGNLDISYITYF